MTLYERNKLMLEAKQKPVDVAIVDPSVRKSFKEFLKLNKEEFAIAGVLCFVSKDGWGWFLFFGLVLI